MGAPGRRGTKTGVVVIHMLWLGPLLVTVAAVVAVAVLVARTGEEAARLRAEVQAVAGLKPSVLEVRARVQALRESLEWLRRT